MGWTCGEGHLCCQYSGGLQDGALGASINWVTGNLMGHSEVYNCFFCGYGADILLCDILWFYSDGFL